jgi:hypothetical protein
MYDSSINLKSLEVSKPSYSALNTLSSLFFNGTFGLVFFDFYSGDSFGGYGSTGLPRSGDDSTFAFMRICFLALVASDYSQVSILYFISSSSCLIIL